MSVCFLKVSIAIMFLFLFLFRAIPNDAYGGNEEDVFEFNSQRSNNQQQ